MNIKNYIRLAALTILLNLSGCLGYNEKACYRPKIENFVISTGAIPNSTQRKHPDGSESIISLAATKKMISYQDLLGNYSCPLNFIDVITGIELRSSTDFDENHPAGTLLNDVFKVQEIFGVIGEPQRLDDLFPLDVPWTEAYHLEFYVSKRPSSLARHRFKLEIFLSTGKVFTVETDEIDLDKYFTS